MPRPGYSPSGIPSARPAERLYVRDRASELAAKRPPAEARTLLERYGLAQPSGPTASGKAVGRVVGAVLPLSGKQRALGEHALRGALLAADRLRAA